MNSIGIRESFLDFFASKQHHIVQSAQMLIKDDPTLMFTNVDMNQFKDIFIGNLAVKYLRIANTQKRLRVSDKHNALEEVGRDTYHHTMSEMLDNLSFGDYFKREAICWAWEHLTWVLKIDKGCLYVPSLGGNEADGFDKDIETFDIWRELVSESRTIFGSKKDNFCEMGETFHELASQKELIIRMIAEGENSFLKTLENGINKFNNYVSQHGDDKVVDGVFAFELFDNYGFSIDLTELIVKEHGFGVDMVSVEKCLPEQAERSKNAASKETGDWVELAEAKEYGGKLCHDCTELDVRAVKYRMVKTAKDEYYQLVFDLTLFYAESGGLIGNSGDITSTEECVRIENMVKENNLVVHIMRTLHIDTELTFIARVVFVGRVLRGFYYINFEFDGTF